MTALEIVSILQPYQEYLIRLQESEAFQHPEHSWDLTVSLSYTFITLKILRGTKDQTRKDLFIQIIFRIENNQILLSEIFHANKIDTQQLIDDIKLNKTLHEISLTFKQQQKIAFSDKILNYLLIADRISMHAVNRYAGDNYWPGNYSTIKLTSNAIVLEQVNHMNSRSLNHKENYSLRSLIFKIPLQHALPFKQSFDDVLLENMVISFSDHSSPNNREAGDAIQEQIKKEL